MTQDDREKQLRKEYETWVNKDTYRETEKAQSFSYEKLYFKLKASIANYLGEKIQ